MARRYLHLYERDDIVRDTEGIDFPSDEAARAYAEYAARELMAEKVKNGEVLDDGRIEVTDEIGAPLFSVPLRSVVRL